MTAGFVRLQLEQLVLGKTLIAANNNPVSYDPL